MTHSEPAREAVAEPAYFTEEQYAARGGTPMIDELIERVESGEGADRAIDGDIFVALGPDHATKLLRHFAREAPAYTTSLDAVLALIEEKLPGAYASLEMGVTGKGNLAEVAIETPNDDRTAFRAEATSPARALLAAFLRAHKEQHDERD